MRGGDGLLGESPALGYLVEVRDGRGPPVDQEDEVVRSAADLFCQEMTNELTGRRPSDSYFRQITALGGAIGEGGFASIAGLQPDEILMPY